MTTSHEGLGFFGKRNEAVSEIQKAIFALGFSRELGPIRDLTRTSEQVYDDLVNRLEELVVEGMEQEVRRRYGGREEGM